MSTDAKHHATLKALLVGQQRVGEECFQELLLHLAEKCDVCETILHRHHAMAPSTPVERFASEMRQDSVVQRSASVALERERIFREEASAVERALRRLLKVPESERLAVIEQDREFHTRALAERLLESAIEKGFERPTQARGLTELAVHLVGHLDREFYGRGAIADLAGRAWATHGNALRLSEDFSAAEKAFERAWLVLRAGTGDPLARARVLSLHSSLLKDQRRFGEADRLLMESIATYTRVGERHLAGRGLLTRAALLEAWNRPQEAIDLLQKAAEMVEPEREPGLEYMARYNLLFLLARCGRATLAQELYREQEAFFARHSAPWQQRRLRWLEGLIATGLGDFEVAERLFESLREEYIHNGESYYWALVSLDLALVYAEAGRNAELRELAEALFVTFQGLDIHREAFASLVLFRRAAESERVTASIVNDLITALKRHPYSPASKPS